MTLPIHLNALRAFEASARHKSFSAAANELNVTPAAVGQLVRTLESWLGVALFERVNKGRFRLIPTQAAELALPDIRAGFEQITAGLEKLKVDPAEKALTVTVSPAFAAKWLLPRIHRFQSKWPEMDVRLETHLRPVDFVALRVDIGVRYGSGSWPGLIAEKLMDESVFPVCSPTFLMENPTLTCPSELTGKTLIHDDSMEKQTNFPNWDAWFKSVNVEFDSARHGLRINNSAAVIQAAMDDRGIALARSVMVEDDLKSGRLIRLFPEINYSSSMAYFIVYRAESAKLNKLSAFRDWLVSEVTTR